MLKFLSPLKLCENEKIVRKFLSTEFINKKGILAIKHENSKDYSKFCSICGHTIDKGPKRL